MKAASARSSVSVVASSQADAVPLSAESFFWTLLQQHFATLSEAVDKIKQMGYQSASAPEHASVLSGADADVSEFVDGLKRLASSLQEQEFAHRYSKSLFQNYNVSGSRRLTIAELMCALSRWQRESSNSNVEMSATGEGFTVHRSTSKATMQTFIRSQHEMEERRRDDILDRLRVERERRRIEDRERVRARDCVRQSKFAQITTSAALLCTERAMNEEARRYRDKVKARERGQEHKAAKEERRLRFVSQQEAARCGRAWIGIDRKATLHADPEGNEERLRERRRLNESESVRKTKLADAKKSRLVVLALLAPRKEGSFPPVMCS